MSAGVFPEDSWRRRGGGEFPNFLYGFTNMINIITVKHDI